MPPESPVKIDHDVGQQGVNQQEHLIMGHHHEEQPPVPTNGSGDNSAADNEDYSGTGPLLFVDSHQVSPGMSDCCWVGAEVQVENKIARRCSYEEMVHEEVNLVGPDTPNDQVTLVSSSLEDKWYHAVTRITQWAIILQEVYEERVSSSTGSGPPTGSFIATSKCLCHKASTIGQKLAHLENLMLQLIVQEQHQQQHQHATTTEASEELNDIVQTVDDVQSALRAGVSIQISKPSEAVITKAVSVVDAAMTSCDRSAYVRSAMDSIVKLVNNLLNVHTCGHASNGNLLDDSDRIRDVSPTRLMEQEEEEDIRSRVASMFNDENDEEDEDSDDESDDAMDTGSSTAPRVARKRKQFLKNNVMTSPTSSPSKRPRNLKSPAFPSQACSMSASPMGQPKIGFCQSSYSSGSASLPASPALDLLETKKKVQRNSLYHWVLWREALRGEKDRLSFN